MLPVTFTFIAVSAVLSMVMTGWIGLLRGRLNILRGDGGSPELFKRIRIHGNFAENAPILALALGAGEVTGLSSGWLWLAVGSFGLGRALHFAIYDNKHRGIAMTFTQAPAVVIGFWVIWQIWWS